MAKNKPKYEKPPGITQKLEISSLARVWHKFRILSDRQLLLGSFAENHRRFSMRTNGFQAPCNCVVALTYAQFIPMKLWDYNVVDAVLRAGNELYMTTIHHQGDRTKTYLLLCEVYPSFYYGDTKVTVTFKGTVRRGSLRDVVPSFFGEHQAGVLALCHRHMALWRADNAFYLFDPWERDAQGHVWNGVRGDGRACVMRFTDIVDLLNVVLDTFCVPEAVVFTMTPCNISRLVKIPLQPPDALLKPHCPKERVVCEFERVKPPAPEPPPPPPVEKCPSVSWENDADVENEVAPVEKPRADSVTYFTCHERMDILRASTHQCDIRYTQQNGKQSAANAVTALAMLRHHKARTWFRKMLDDVLKHGERYFGDTTKKLSPGTVIKVSNLNDKLVLYEQEYAPLVDEYAIVGRLQSLDSGVLDLLPALKDFFRCWQTCVITGPVIVAAWVEDGLFYMFDPNERDEKGRIVMKVEDYTPGVACVTRFADLQQMVELYMVNVEPRLRRETFLISKVTVEDYASKPENWHNFTGVNEFKWILRGTFNQNDRRFEKDVRNVQGTAASAIALAMAYLKSTKEWTRSDVDDVLIAAQEYHVASVADLKHSGKYREPKLQVNELMRRYVVEGNEITFDIRECLVNGLVEDLRAGFDEFFAETDYGVLTCRETSVAVWRGEHEFFYYDSHSCDEEGLTCNYGTACVMRLLTVGELVRAVETNLGPNGGDHFNLGGFTFVVWQLGEGGVARPPLHNYVEVNAFACVLRGVSSERSSRFGLNAGKQTVPMCLASAAMAKVFPPGLWNVDVVEEILTVGDRLFTDTMIAREREANLPAEKDVDEVFAENSLMEFNIGVNKFVLRYGEPFQGNFEDDFRRHVAMFYAEPDGKTLFVTSDFYSVMTWYDDNVYYLFDPKPRDDTGQIYGKEEWSAKLEEAGEEGGLDWYDMDRVAAAKLGGSGDALPTKHSASFWRAREENGRACSMWFVTLHKLIEHIYENTPPNRRLDMHYKLYPVHVGNRPDLKRCYEPPAPPEDEYAGPWHAFKEMDYGRWILSGTFHNEYVMFPKANRGQQQIAMCYTAVGFVKRFALSRFAATTVDDILKYGDRLHSATRKHVVPETIREFCVGLDQIQLRYVDDAVVVGDIHAEYDVPRAVADFFETYRYGILSCRNLTVALWRSGDVYYMFDSNSNGPAGLASPSGEACITRYLQHEHLADVFLKNLTKQGRTLFELRPMQVRIVPCPRPLKPEEKPLPSEPPVRYTGITGVMPGKCILRGTFSQEDDRFGRGRNVQSAAVAVIALSMSLVHRPQTWTTHIVDDVLMLGDELYAATLETLGYEYNPWENALTVALVNKDYKVGSLRANFQAKATDQRGVIDVKHPQIANLRQGLERFFEENTHGVVESEPLTVAVWEEQDRPGYVYMYDPNPRGPGGYFADGGSACMLIFETAKMAAEHFVGNVPDRVQRASEFVITPVEIVVGKTGRTPKKEPRCKSLQRKPSKVCDKALAKIGRHDYHSFSNGDGILRGTRSQSSKHYSPNSRGFQDIPNCFAAFVVHRLSPVNTWHFKHVDMILDVGDQLYKDSYVTYNPKDPKLGMANVLRKIFIKEVQVTLIVYRPVMSNALTPENLEVALVNYFHQEQFGILSVENEHVALFFKEGFYYVFRPQRTDVHGVATDDESGVACVLKFQTIPNLVAKCVENAPKPVLEPEPYDFSITLITVGSIAKANERAPCCIPNVTTGIL